MMTVRAIAPLLAGLGLLACGANWSGVQSDADPLKQAPMIRDWRVSGVGQRVADMPIQLIGGQRSRLSSLAGTKPTVIIFTSATCPISKKYTETYRRMEKSWKDRGVQVMFVNALAGDTDAEARDHAKKFQSPYAMDRGGLIAAGLKAETTTEVFVLDASRTMVYRGAIDDQYGFGFSLDKPKRSYAEEAVAAILAKTKPEVKSTTAPGCKLETKAVPVRAMEVTYHNQISRIIQNNCMTCHRPGGVGPFALDSYEAVKRRGEMLKFVINSGRMPPWFAKPEHGATESKWRNDASLTEADRKLFTQWVDGGAKAGDPKDAPAPIQWPEGWGIGTPDVVYQAPRPTKVKADGFMNYVVFEVDTGAKEDKWIQAMQILPSARQVVHHVLVFVLRPGDRMSEDLEGVGGFFAGYVPGNDNVVFPKGFARRLPAGSRLRFQIHYSPNGEAVEDVTKLGLVYADAPPENEVQIFALSNLRLNIPPGKKGHEEYSNYRLPFDIKVHSFMPHMHVRGAGFRYDVTPLGGERTTVLYPTVRFQLAAQLRTPRASASEEGFDDARHGMVR